MDGCYGGVVEGEDGSTQLHAWYSRIGDFEECSILLGDFS